jgi:hypothetical protein
VDDILDMLAGSIWRSSLDLVSGYWQIPVQEDNIEKTAFAMRHRTYEFTMMLFGLTNAPASFQRDMDIILSGLNWVSTLVYIDNIIIFSATFDDHLLHLQAVFNWLHKANMFVKPLKCNFCCTELPFLGHLVRKDGIAANPKKIQAVRDMAQLANATKVQAFLGLCNYYHWFVPAFAELAAPLYQLLCGEPFRGIAWTEECRAAFVALKEALTTVPVLVFPDFKSPFYLHTDASKRAIGAVLSQRTPAGEERVVAYASQQLSKSERNYSVTEWECLSIVYWIEYFHQYLHSSKFHVITDHAALKWLMDAKEQRGRLAWWAMKLQPYEFEIVYRPGAKHDNAEQCELFDGLLYHHAWPQRGTAGTRTLARLAIPASRIDMVMHAHHDDLLAGHLGRNRTIAAVKHKYWWPRMAGSIAAWVASCEQCQRRKAPHQGKNGPLHPLPVASRPFERVSMDLMGPFRESD